MRHLLEQGACRDLMTWVGLDLLMTSLFVVSHISQSNPKAEVVGHLCHSNLMVEVLWMLRHLCHSIPKVELGLQLLSVHCVDLGRHSQNKTYQNPIMYRYGHHKVSEITR